MSRPVVAGHGARTSARLLPLEAAVEATPTGWSVRLPLRMEVVTVAKATVLRESVRVCRRQTEHVETVTATARAERLRRDDIPGDGGDATPRP